MAYEKTYWRTGDTVTAAKLNNAENGIEQNSNSIDTIETNLGQAETNITGLQTDVAALQTATADLETLVVDFGTISSLPATVTNDAITDDMAVVGATLGTPAAQPTDWTVTTSAGSVTVSGTINGSTTLTIYLTKTRSAE